VQPTEPHQTDQTYLRGKFIISAIRRQRGCARSAVVFALSA
jgi:hypothetical protein